MRRMKPNFNSLMFQLFLAVFFIIGPLVIIHVINNYYANEVIRNQVAQSNKNMLNIYMDQIDKDLKGVGNYIFQLSSNTDLYFLQDHENFDLNDYEEAKIRLFNSINNQSHFYTAIDSIFLYSSSYRDFLNTKENNVNFSERMNATEEIHVLFQNKPENLTEGKWNLWRGKKNYYLLYYLNIDGVYVGSWVNMDNLVNPFKYIDFGETGRAMLATSDWKPITNEKFIEDEKIDLTFDRNEFKIFGKKEQFLTMKEKSTMADFYLLAFIPESEILEKLPFLQRISSFISTGAVLFLFLFIFIMRKIFLQPINQIVSAMRKLRHGDMEIRLPVHRNSTEFEVMNGTFNHMISEIRDLKINVYEEKLNLQRAELKHLQLQINPHFFLNSLNIIYSLATVKEFAIIQEMSKCLADYFRFMFSSNSYFVSLEDELKHTENYLKIQQLRFPKSINYYIESPGTLMKCYIPPLIIQTIAENSIKHAFHMDEPINIYITVKKDADDPSFMEIKIQDTGEGFPEEVLSSLETGDPLTTKKGERIGLWNVKRRLNLLYDGITSIHFSNEQGRGATVRMRLPISNSNNEKGNDDE